MNEELRDLIVGWEVDLNRSIVTRQREVARELRALFRELARLYREIEPLKPQRRRYQAERTDKFNEAARLAIETAYRGIFRDESTYHRLIVGLTEQFLYNTMQEAVGAQLLDDPMTRGEVNALSRTVEQDGHDSRYWWERDADSTASAVAGMASYALTHQVAQPDALRELRREFEKALNKSATLVQTFAIGNANAAALETYARNDDVISSIQWVATLDTRTSDICRRLDGKRWRLPSRHVPGSYRGYTPIGHGNSFPGSTAHFNERSTTVPIVVELRKLPPSKARQIPERTRSSLDGRVPATTTYYEWLQRTSPSRQRDALGKERYDIMINEGLRVSDLLDFRGNPLSVERLVERYGA